MHVDRRVLIESWAPAGPGLDDYDRFGSVAGRKRGGLTGSELRVQGDDPIRRELAEPTLRPASDDKARDQMEIGTRVDVVLDAGRDDRQDGGGAMLGSSDMLWATTQAQSRRARAA